MSRNRRIKFLGLALFWAAWVGWWILTGNLPVAIVSAVLGGTLAAYWGYRSWTG